MKIKSFLTVFMKPFEGENSPSSATDLRIMTILFSLTSVRSQPHLGLRFTADPSNFSWDEFYTFCLRLMITYLYVSHILIRNGYYLGSTPLNSFSKSIRLQRFLRVDYPITHSRLNLIFFNVQFDFVIFLKLKQHETSIVDCC